MPYYSASKRTPGELGPRGQRCLSRELAGATHPLQQLCPRLPPRPTLEGLALSLGKSRPQPWQPWQPRCGSATRAAPEHSPTNAHFGSPVALNAACAFTSPNCTRERIVCSHLTRSRHSVFIDMERCPQHIVERKKRFTRQPAESAPVHLKPCTYVFIIRQRCPRMFTKTVPGVVSGRRIWGDFLLSSWYVSVTDFYNNEHVSYFKYIYIYINL